MSKSKRARLHPLLVQAYNDARDAREFNAVVTLWVALGFGNPVHGQ